MPPQARGSQTQIVLYDETAFGQAPGTPDGIILPFTTSRLRGAQPHQDSSTLSPQRVRRRPTRQNLNVSGPIATELNAESLGQILRHTLGANATTGVGPFVHTLTIDDLPIGLTIEKDHGANVAGPAQFEQFHGCRVSTARFDFPQQGFPTAEFEFLGASHELSSTALDGTPTDNGFEPFSAFEAAIEEGGASIAVVTQVNFQLNNELDPNGYALGGGGTRRHLNEGFATITGELTAMFESETLLNKAINGTESSLKVTVSRGTGDGSAGNESIEYLLNQLEYERTSPGIEGPQGILITLPFRGYLKTGSEALQITLKNAVATI